MIPLLVTEIPECIRVMGQCAFNTSDRKISNTAYLRTLHSRYNYIPFHGVLRKSRSAKQGYFNTFETVRGSSDEAGAARLN